LLIFSLYKLGSYPLETGGLAQKKPQKAKNSHTNVFDTSSSLKMSN